MRLISASSNNSLESTSRDPERLGLPAYFSVRTGSLRYGFRRLLCATIGGVICLSLCGCEDFLETSDDDSSSEEVVDVGPDASGDGSDDSDSSSDPVSGGSVPADFSGVTWLHHNVSGWAQTASLNAGVGGSVNLNYDKARVWPARNVGGTDVNANAWIFVFQDGRWYAATWEWLRPGQTSKSTRAVHGDHIKKSPLNDFVPRSGEVYGFMVSGLARDSTRNVEERSNVDMVRWP